MNIYIYIYIYINVYGHSRHTYTHLIIAGQRNDYLTDSCSMVEGVRLCVGGCV
jgi:hypothetical protein